MARHPFAVGLGDIRSECGFRFGSLCPAPLADQTPGISPDRAKLGAASIASEEFVVAFLLLLILAFVGILVWQFIETRNALATTSVVSRYAPERSAQLIDTAFGGARSMLWTNTSGPGTINKRRRGWRRGITMSITIEPLPEGGARIDMWASQYAQYLFVLANFAGVVNRRKRAITRILAEPASRPAVSANGQAGIQAHHQAYDQAETQGYDQAGARGYHGRHSADR